MLRETMQAARAVIGPVPETSETAQKGSVSGGPVMVDVGSH